VQHVLQDGDLIRPVRHRLLSRGQPQPVAEYGEQMGSQGPLLTTTP
jgi:hypothetical protein